MSTVRRLAYLALGTAYALIVFGAIVRISGSGMGCGDNWPRCYGRWFPPLDQPTLVIEWTHRLLAGVTLTLVALLVIAAVRQRGQGERMRGRGSVLRAASIAALLVVLQAILGMVTVRMGNTPTATVAHLLNGALLLAALAATVVRAGGLGGEALVGTPIRSTRAARGAAAAAAIALIAVLFGGLTAKIPGANSACVGFPLCRGSILPALPIQHVQFTHRLIAFLLFFHVLGLMIGFAKRREAPVVVRTLRIAFALILAQLLIAAAMVEMQLPPVLRSLHEADGIVIWLSLFILACLARRAPEAGAITRLGAHDPLSPRHGSMAIPHGESAS